MLNITHQAEAHQGQRCRYKTTAFDTLLSWRQKENATSLSTRCRHYEKPRLNETRQERLPKFCRLNPSDATARPGYFRFQAPHIASAIYCNPIRARKEVFRERQAFMVNARPIFYCQSALWHIARKPKSISVLRLGDPPIIRLPTFAGFPTFCPMTFHLFASYSLIAAKSAVLYTSMVRLATRAAIRRLVPRPLRTRHSACPNRHLVHWQACC